MGKPRWLKFTEQSAREGTVPKKTALKIYRGHPSSLILSVDQYMHMRKLPQIGKRTTGKEQVEQFSELTQGWE